MPSPLARGKAALERARSRSPLADHVIRMQQHYGRVNGGGQAGAVTYYAFLSFFPILALAFFAVGYLARIYPEAQDNLVSAIQEVLPGIVTTASPAEAGSRQISISSIESAATAVGIIGLVGVLYAGLSWLSGMRSALQTVFEMPRHLQPSFLIGKLRDLVTLVIIGLTLMLSVAVTGAVVGYSTKILDLVDAGHGLTWLVEVIGLSVGVGTNMLLFYVLFRLLARPLAPRRALWQGALLGGLAFEALKLASSYLLRLTQHQPAFQAFGIALVLLIWINYFSRIVMYAAAWAHTSRPARTARDAEQTRSEAEVHPAVGATVGGTAARSGPDPRVAFGAGAVTALGLVALVRRRRR
jgi:membrane protein